ncbi:MAG: hypothetical protein LBO80_07375 [Treponema sp.]|jgi:hypothetical protein|nr:hypothetical protein [Treponema sp.]
MKGFTVSFIIGLCCTVSAFGVDFGVTLDQRLEYNQDGQLYTGSTGPWLSAGISEKVQFYLSGNIAINYAQKAWDKPLPLPELSRLELNYRPESQTLIKAGRFVFNDSSGMIASGAFDGLYGEMQTTLGRVSAGLWYTGLLYRETAKIIMTGSDSIDYSAPWDGIDTYFAPRRLLADIRWDIPGILGPLNVLTLEGLAQFDLSDHEDTLHSQYLEVQYAIVPVPGLQVSLGGIMEVLEDGAGEYGIAFAALAETGIRLPGLISHRLFLGGNFSSGNRNDRLIAFVPLSGHPAGSLFTQTMSSLGRIHLGYKARLHETLSLDTGVRCFMRTGSEALFYGGEIYASLLWAPLDDIAVTLGGGAFFPRRGNVFDSGTDPVRKIVAGIVLSF